MKELHDNNYKDILAQPGLLLIDFGATWCGPCKKVHPILETLSKEMEAVAFFNCDVGNAAEVAAHFNIFSVPTVVIIKDGEEKSRLIGLRNHKQYRAELDKHLA